MKIKKPGESEKFSECYERCDIFGAKRNCKLVGLLVVDIPQDLKDWAKVSGTILDVVEIAMKTDVPATSGTGAAGAIIDSWIERVSKMMSWRVYAVCEYDDCEWCMTEPGFLRRWFGEESQHWLGWSRWKSIGVAPLKPEWGGDFGDVVQDSDGTMKVPQGAFSKERLAAIFKKFMEAAEKECGNICKTQKK